LTIILALVLVYAVSLFGVAKQKRWGFILTIVISAIDLFSALVIGGAKGVGAEIFDMIVLVLAILELRK
jgi:hypothetical protein